MLGCSTFGRRGVRSKCVNWSSQVCSGMPMARRRVDATPRTSGVAPTRDGISGVRRRNCLEDERSTVKRCGSASVEGACAHRQSSEAGMLMHVLMASYAQQYV